jgi:hypothetical protein
MLEAVFIILISAAVLLATQSAWAAGGKTPPPPKTPPANPTFNDANINCPPGYGHPGTGQSGCVKQPTSDGKCGIGWKCSNDGCDYCTVDPASSAAMGATSCPTGYKLSGANCILDADYLNKNCPTNGGVLNDPGNTCGAYKQACDQEGKSHSAGCTQYYNTTGFQDGQACGMSGTRGSTDDGSKACQDRFNACTKGNPATRDPSCDSFVNSESSQLGQDCATLSPGDPRCKDFTAKCKANKFAAGCGTFNDGVMSGMGSMCGDPTSKQPGCTDDDPSKCALSSKCDVQDKRCPPIADDSAQGAKDYPSSAPNGCYSYRLKQYGSSKDIANKCMGEDGTSSSCAGFSDYCTKPENQSKTDCKNFLGATKAGAGKCLTDSNPDQTFCDKLSSDCKDAQQKSPVCQSYRDGLKDQATKCTAPIGDDVKACKSMADSCRGITDDSDPACKAFNDNKKASQADMIDKCNGKNPPSKDTCAQVAKGACDDGGLDDTACQKAQSAACGDKDTACKNKIAVAAACDDPADTDCKKATDAACKGSTDDKCAAKLTAGAACKNDPGGDDCASAKTDACGDDAKCKDKLAPPPDDKASKDAAVADKGGDKGGSGDKGSKDNSGAGGKGNQGDNAPANCDDDCQAQLKRLKDDGVLKAGAGADPKSLDKSQNDACRAAGIAPGSKECAQKFAAAQETEDADAKDKMTGGSHKGALNTTNDKCKSIVYGKAVEDYVKSGMKRDEAVKLVNSRVAAGEYDNYKCDDVEDTLAGTQLGSQMTSQLGQAAAQTAGQSAVTNVQQFQGPNATPEQQANVQKQALLSMAQAERNVAYTQMGMAAAQGIFTVMNIKAGTDSKHTISAGGSILDASNQDAAGMNMQIGDQDAMKKFARAGGHFAGHENDENLQQHSENTMQALGTLMSKKKLGRDESEDLARGEVSKAMEVAKKNKKAADMQALQSGMQMVVAAAGAASNMMQAQALEDEANQLGTGEGGPTGPGINPLNAEVPQGRADGGTPPPTLTPQANVGSGGAAATAEPDGASGGPPAALPPPLFGGGGNPGGLKDGAPPPSGGTVGAGTTSGGGGGLGSAGGGGGGGADSAGDKAGGDGVGGPPTKFDSAGAGGGGFAAGPGGGGKRSQDTGMDLSGLLSQFMPKKEEDRKPSSILDFSGKGKDGNAGPGNVDDGSILGPNSNLFMRVTTTTQTYYKKGHLR